MNNSSPFASSTPEPKNTSRSRVRLAVFCVLSVNIAGLLTLLLTNGCRKPDPEPLPPEPTNTFSDFPPLEPGTNVDTALLPTNAPDPLLAQPSNVPPIDPFAAQPPVQPQPTPTYTPEPVQTFQPATQEYTVVKGDTFSGIAKKYPGVSVRALQDANPNVQPTRLKIGQKIVIPAPSVGSSTGVAPQFSPEPAATEGRTYTVKAGDTLTGIARRNGVSVRAIRNANNLRTDRINVGQKLKIPARASANGVTPLPTPPPGLEAPVPSPSPAPFTNESAPAAPGTLTPPGQL